ncbi:phytanoyl-CoA dioxygenase family protein [Paenibacillus sp. GYB003]|uniref:phytanoyl-CoA dioxygenase family protein n=1 Tax=Paenibacillus sp. GYB003 TaxID=2994392 RepID=UPI002F96BD0C
MLRPADNPMDVVAAMYRFDQMAKHRVPAPEHVTEETVRTYRELGYVAIDNVLNGEEVAAALRDIDDVIQGRIVGPKIQCVRGKSELKDGGEFASARERELCVRKLHKFIDYCPALHHICYHPKIWGVLEMVFGETPRFCEDQALLKPPSADAGIEKPWHQDMAYGNFSYTKMVAGVWVALDEAALDNGCMHVIPGSHRNGPVPHYAVRDWQLCDTAVDVAKDEVVPLKPGGLLVFSGLLHHGTPPNLSDKRRRALQFHYAPESAVKMTPDAYKLAFTNEMTKAEC